MDKSLEEIVLLLITDESTRLDSILKAQARSKGSTGRSREEIGVGSGFSWYDPPETSSRAVLKCP